MTTVTTDLWVSKTQAADFESISVREVCRRCGSGELRSELQNGVRVIDPRSMTVTAQKRWREASLGEPSALNGKPMPLFPETDLDMQIAALGVRQTERDVILRRYRIVDLCLNRNWKAERYPSKREFVATLAKRNETSIRSIQRWVSVWKQSHDLKDLIRERTGPEPGAGSHLDDDMQAHLIDYYVLMKLRPAQCYRSLLAYLEGKQRSVGCRVDHIYHIPSERTVRRFLASLSPIDEAARQGTDALKAACGHVDRSYRDLRSLERVDVDEWICDVLAYDPRRASRVGRYYVLTFLDERSIYPLVWSLVEQPNEEAEIDLLCRLILEFGVPGLINSDRGRFRGRTFGGRFVTEERSETRQKRDGILDRLGIGRNLPREHNPRGSRLERFHRQLADWARTVPGWCGSDTKQRRMTDADQRSARHKDWVRTGEGNPPLLSRDQLLERLNVFMAEVRLQPSEGTDMDGFAPEAVFLQNMPPDGFRRISEEDLGWHTAEYFNVIVGKGGIVQLRDGKRYSHPELVLIQGERREAARLRHNHDQISILPSAKGQKAIVAPRRARAGVNDPDELSRQMESQARLRKLVGIMVNPLEYDPAAHFADAGARSEPPKSVDVIHPSEFIAAQQGPAIPPESEVSSVEFLMEHDRYKSRVKQPLDFADLEY